MMGNGSMDSAGGPENKDGLMVLNMRGIGLKTKHMVMVFFVIMMAMSMKGNGNSIRQMVLGSIRIVMEPPTKENGEMINKKGKEWKDGPMDLIMKVSTMKGENMAKVRLYLLMDLTTRGNLIRIISTDKEYTLKFLNILGLG